jgi:hypothetical protein
VSRQIDAFLEEAKQARARAQAADEPLKTEWLKIAETWESLAAAYRQEYPSTDLN